MPEGRGVARAAARVAAPSSPRESVALDVLARVLADIHGSRREGQERMVREVWRCVRGGGHLLLQAGTGTGKSIGYLVPVLADCALESHRAVVSTATLALQRQILVHDAPAVIRAVREVTGVRPKVGLLKGWSNYACLQRLGGGYPPEGAALFDAPRGPEAPPTSLAAQIARVRTWARETPSGDRDELVPGVSDRAWSLVSVNRRECLGRACPMREQCFPRRAREATAGADLVVTNHAVLGIQATGRANVVPEADVLVVDEAHELAQRVRRQATQELSPAGIRRAASRVRRVGTVDTERLEQAGARFGAALGRQTEGLLTRRPEDLEGAIRILAAEVRRCEQSLSDGPDPASRLLARAGLDAVSEGVEAWGGDPCANATWVARTPAGEVLRVAPLDVSRVMGARLFGGRPAVLTSATLTLGETFDAIARASGIAGLDAPWGGIDVGTPLRPEHQGILYVARHLPPPGRNGPAPEALRELADVARAAGGGMLALFSSRRGVEAGARALREVGGLSVLVQGEESLATLVASFRQNRDSCLVGTLSLWQGVDVPGDSCRVVAIDRIPFPRPDEPLAKARVLAAQRAGRNGFFEVCVTHAALLMDQAAGRLLRGPRDRGMVVVLDPRLVTKPYGGFIRRSMPRLWPTTDRAVALTSLRRLAPGPA